MNFRPTPDDFDVIASAVSQERATQRAQDAMRNLLARRHGQQKDRRFAAEPAAPSAFGALS